MSYCKPKQNYLHILRQNELLVVGKCFLNSSYKNKNCLLEYFVINSKTVSSWSLDAYL